LKYWSIPPTKAIEQECII